ncbi:uncharacterized protein [Typha latifolia]|uniref:uncharacterized protein n=1 Tax=Typha latifolia TaxID=4733 RepID=UPI003C3077F5
MAEAAAISVARWVASPIVSRLLKEGFNYLGLELGDADVKERLENLETTILPQFHLVIEAAERSNDDHKAKLKLWLRKLKDAMYEAEDMLDLCKYQLLEEKVHDLNSDSISKPFRKVGRGLSKILSSQNKKLRESLTKLENVAAEAIKFHEYFLGEVGIRSITANDTTGASGVNVTTSLPPHYVIGRDEERDEIIDKYLLDSSEDCEPELSIVSRINYSVVIVTGIGGAGKTTLAQLVYNDQRVIDNFGIKMWVCMSRKLDVFKLIREMIESASKNECPHLKNLDALQSTLTDMIKSKRVLLVLDDVWCYKSENKTEWEQLLAPLAFGERGSKILVTSRPENISNMPVELRTQSIMKLKDLGEDEFVSLFMHHAFRGTKLSESHLQEELEKIGKQILQKLCKSPLAAKAVGGQLSKRLQSNFWRAALEQDNLSDAQKALMWSYNRLDAPLQRCFSYFSLFPKGHTFKMEKMIHLWMAEGFINPSDKGKRMEDIGNDYFDELVSGSFLQLLENYGYGMHDLFHDLAENISKEDCFRIESDQAEEIPSTIRHLYIRGESMRRGMLKFHKLQNLRTLIVAGPVSKIDSDLLLTVMEKSKKLRVLDLSFNVSIKTLPKCIRDLKHLRYLDLRFSSVAELPMSLGKLHHLQVLKSPYKVKVLPRSLRNLFNLRHLKAEDEALSTLPDIGRLTYLQELEYFEVKKENGHDIRQLKNLNELRRSLTISGLEKVEGKDEVTGADLKDKKHLDSLCLKWYSDTESDRRTNLDMEIVEALQPPPNLTKLEIHGCKSLRCPSWLSREGCLENLKSLGFNDTSFKVLPTISSKLFPRCQELEIRSLPNLRMLPLLPQTLRTLVIESCPLLVFVSEEELQKSEVRKESIITVIRSPQLEMAFELMGDIRNIRTMIASDCLDVKKLMESEMVDIPEDFQTFATALEGEEMSMQVDYLRLWEAYCCCQEQRLEAIFRRRERSELILPSELQHLKICSTNITDGALSLCLGGLSSLDTLKLRRIRTITTVPTDHLMALCDLEIVGCHCLKSLGGLHALLCLKDLHISSCPCLELEMMEGEGGGRFIFPPSLQSLDVYNSCCNVKRFAIGYLPDLHRLHLDKWSSLASLSLSGLTALRYLDIKDCPQLSAVDCSQAPNNSSLESLGGTEDVPKLAAAPPSEAVHSSSVKDLKISSCATLSMLLSGNNSKSLVIGLRGLTLWCCPEASFLEEHFSSLISLRSLSLYNCQVQSLPRILKSLSSLEHLILDDCPNISSLTDLPHSLLSLTLIECPGISSLPVHLPGSLRSFGISGCPVLKERCRESKGEDWPKIAHIPSVWISWDSGTENNRRMNLDMEIVEALQPPPNLTELLISGCKSLRCPSWLAREGCLENLKSLGFKDTSFKVLPTISSKLFPRCQELEIRSLPNLRTLPMLPQTLRKLVIKSCPLLVFVSEEELQKSEVRKESIITVIRSPQLEMAFELMGDIRNIRTMIARECLDVKKLMESEKVDIPEDFQTFATALEGEEMSMQVDYLRLWEAYCCCQEQRLEAIFRRRERSELILPSGLQHLKICSTNITDGALSLCLGGLASLKTLRLRRIRTITTVPTDHLMALSDLEIDNCHCLKSLGGLHALLSLKVLCISSCPCLELEMMEGEGGGRFIFPPSLQSLSVRDNSCCNVKRFAIGDLPDLHNLSLSKWSSLASLSLSGLTALRYLGIKDCPQLSAVDCSQAPNNSSLESLGGTDDVPKLAAAPPSEAVHSSSVKDLKISSCATLSMLLSGNNSKSLVIGLRALTLSHCTEASLLEEHFSCLISLRRLSLNNCQVQSLPRILKSLSSLEHLSLYHCPHISSLPDLPHSLLHLSLHGCPGILSLPVRLPESLRSFSISGCQVLEERCREPKGEDWPKIAHIPRVLIGD